MNECSERPARRRAGRIAGAGLLVLAVVGGIGFTAVRVAGADRDPGTPVWKFAAAAENDRKGPASKDPSGLRAPLLPYDVGYQGYGQGPDIGEFGSEAALSGRQATDLAKRAARDLPVETRKKLDELIDEEHIQGMATRSYAPFDLEEKVPQAFTIRFQLERLASPGAARDLSASREEVFKGLGVFPKGPAIDGHDDAACFLTRAKDDGKIARMFCTASVGDVLVTADASGPPPVGTSLVAALVGRQLDRIKDQGKAV